MRWYGTDTDPRGHTKVIGFTRAGEFAVMDYAIDPNAPGRGDVWFLDGASVDRPLRWAYIYDPTSGGTIDATNALSVRMLAEAGAGNVYARSLNSTPR